MNRLDTARCALHRFCADLMQTGQATHEKDLRLARVAKSIELAIMELMDSYGRRLAEVEREQFELQFQAEKETLGPDNITELRAQ